ncbi:MAG: Cna B-type domain-containing protein, partial [Anaerolineae bacterium]|nr:Cna B-type domain-containing protein [Anaerolineae bacterium]
MWRPASLGDYVWEDINHDGQQNDPSTGSGQATTGVNGVTVTLYSNGVPVNQTQTYTFGGVPGYYTFTNLISATYSVTFQAPAGYQFTLQDVGADNTDSDVNAVTGATGNYVLNAGQSIPTVDAGIWRPASLGDYVWEDLNHDGQQNDGPTGVNGVPVALLDVNGNVVSTTTTFQGGPANANGYYTFTNLISGTYTVSFTLPAGYTWTQTNVGADGTDSDGVPAGNVAVAGPYVLNAGESNPTVDQGVWRPASLGDLVWYDQNHDGVQQPNEPGVPNVQVSLQTPTTTLIATTSITGYYTFENLISGVPYTVTFGQPPTGYTFTLPTV